MSQNLFINLRIKTEDGFKWQTIDLSTQSLSDISKIIQNFQVQQIELEKQNRILKQSLNKSEESLSNYSFLYEDGHFGAITLDKSGLIIESNKTFLTIIGLEKKEIIGKPFHNYISKEDLVVFYMIRSKSLSTKSPQECEIQIQKKGGSKIPVKLNCIAVVKDDEKKSGQLQITIIDFTEVKRLQETLNNRYEFEKIISAFSRKVITSKENELDGVINQALKLIGNYSKVERVYVGIFSDSFKNININYEWCDNGINSKIQNLLSDDFKELVNSIKKFKTIQVPNIDLVPLDSKFKLQDFHINGMKSFAATPIIFEQTAIGIIGYDSKIIRKLWIEDLITLLKISGDFISFALFKKQSSSKSIAHENTFNLAKEIVELYDIPVSLIEEIKNENLNQEIKPKDNWGFKRKIHIGIEDKNMENIPKAFVKKNNMVLVSCSQCLRQKLVSTDEILGLGNILEVKCHCNSIFDIRLEYRRSYRKKINLDGIFARTSINKYNADDEWGRIHLENISIKGIGFTTISKHNLKMGEQFKVKFTLDDELKFLINLEVTVRNIRDNYIGCEFMDSDSYNKILGFYLKG